MSKTHRIIYYNPESDAGLGSVFRYGEAWQVSPDPLAPLENENSVTKLKLDPTTCAGLFSLGLVDKLQHLPMLFGPIDEFEEAILLPSGLIEGAKLLREICNSLPREDQDVLCGSQDSPDKVVYRMIIDMGVVKKSLLRLADFFEEAAQKQLGVQLWF